LCIWVNRLRDTNFKRALSIHTNAHGKITKYSWINSHVWWSREVFNACQCLFCVWGIYHSSVDSCSLSRFVLTFPIILLLSAQFLVYLYYTCILDVSCTKLAYCKYMAQYIRVRDLLFLII